MFWIILVLLLLTKALFAEAKILAFNEDSVGGRSVNSITSQLTDDAGSPLSGMPVRDPQEESGRSWVRANPMLTGHTAEPGALMRTGTAQFIEGMVTDMSAVAFRVQHFVNSYSTYDSGADQYPRAAVRIRPHIDRGRAWVSVQLRL